jgi:oxygen-dependent protoporphyrinogen oxidase
MFRRRRSGLGPPRLLSFDRGMRVVVDAMTEELSGSIVCDAAVSSIERCGDSWRVRLEDRRVFAADHLVLATSAPVAAPLLREVDSTLSQLLSDVVYSGVAVVGLGYRAADVPRRLDGYGYLVTRPEGLATLGVVWESSLFAGRAPDGHVLLRAMLGGSRVPDMANRPEAECLQVARAELTRVMGVHADPVHVSVHRWPRAIAQFTVGHQARVERLRERAATHRGLHLCGTSYDGVSFNHAVKSGRTVARTIAEALRTSGARSGTAIEATA